MIRLLDSNAVAAIMRGDVAMREYLKKLPQDAPLGTSVIVEGELRFGVLRLPPGKKQRGLREALEVTLGGLDCVFPVSQDVAACYAQTRAQLEKVGRPIMDNDLWIAVTALTHGSILVSRDQVFSVVPDLQREDWSTGATGEG